MILSHLFEISTGYTFRDAIETLGRGNVGVVQAGDVNSAQMASVPRVGFTNERHMLHAGDLLISSRGRTVARTVKPDILPAVAASSVFVLRPISESIDSRYVAQYLNSKSGQLALSKLTSGATIRTINKRELSELDIPIVSTAQQTTLYQLGESITEQQRILHIKQKLLDDLWNSTIANATKGLNQ